MNQGLMTTSVDLETWTCKAEPAEEAPTGAQAGQRVHKGPQAPPTPNLELMMSTEVDTYLRAVHEVDTADEAIALWRPGPTKPSQLKRLQQEPKWGKGRRGGFNGQGYGGKRGYVGKHGGRGGGRGGYGYSGPVPTVVNSGIHYHCY